MYRSVVVSRELVEELVGAPVSSFEVKSGSTTSDGMMGSLLSLKVELEGVGVDPLDLVLKRLPDRESQRNLAVSFNMFWTENAFYAQIVPRLRALLQRASRLDIQLPFPKHYHTFNDDQNDHLCLEDLRPNGYRMPDKFVGLNFGEADAVMGEVGKFHALTYALLKYEGEKIFETPIYEGKSKTLQILTTDFFSTPPGKAMGEVMFNGCWEVAKDLLDGELKERLESLRVKNILEIALRTRNDPTNKYFTCIVQGDLWLNNILIKYGDDEKPISVKFVDFQLTHKGNALEDLGYLITTSTTPELRRVHLPKLLETYYEGFTRTLDQLGVDGPHGFTRGFFFDSFYETLESAYFYLPFAIPLQLGDASIREQEESSEQAQWLQDFMAKTKKLMECPAALARFREITKEMLEMGILK